MLGVLDALSESLSASDLKTEAKQDFSGQVTASRERLDKLASKRIRDEENETIKEMPLPIININNKRQKQQHSLDNTDPIFASIVESVVVLPDNWHTLNSRKSSSSSSSAPSNIPKSKRKQQEKGSNYQDRMKSKIETRKEKTKKLSKQKKS